MDMRAAEVDAPMSVEAYFDMIGRKTAALIAGSIEAGALLASDDDEVVRRYRAFGWDLGMAFQLNDDLLGIWGDEQATGKEPTDIARHKKTLPLLYAFEHAAPAERTRLTELAALPELSAAEVVEMRSILERAGADTYTRSQAHAHRDRALAELDAAGVVRPEARAALEDVIRRVISA
jgi:geranylgeranyl pyrophosphate synthase